MLVSCDVFGESLERASDDTRQQHDRQDRRGGDEDEISPPSQQAHHESDGDPGAVARPPARHHLRVDDEERRQDHKPSLAFRNEDRCAEDRPRRAGQHRREIDAMIANAAYEDLEAAAFERLGVERVGRRHPFRDLDAEQHEDRQNRHHREPKALLGSAAVVEQTGRE